MQTIVSPRAQAQPLYEITAVDRKRQKQIRQAWQAYDGELERPLQPMEGQPDDNVMSNRCQPIVDRGIDFLFGKELEIAVGKDAPAEAQDILNRIWGSKETRIPLLQNIAMNGALAGHAFLRIVPSRSGNIRLVLVDPATVYIQTAQQDSEVVLLYCIEYAINQNVNGKPSQVYYREEIARVDPSPDDDTDGYEDVNAAGIDSDVTWSIQHWSRIGDRGNWTPSGDPIVWPYPFPPLFGCQNLPRPNDPWGKPDISGDIINMNKSLNLLQSNINRIEKLYGAPLLYATGVGESVIDLKLGRIHGLPLTESKIASVALPSDVGNALIFAGNLRSDIDEQSGVPGVATGRLTDMPRGTVSGIALELLFMPLLKKTEKKRCLYGNLIIDVSRAILIVMNIIKPGDDIEINLPWQYPLPQDDLPSVQAAVAKIPLGISSTTLQRELGYDPEEELALSQDEDARKLLAYSKGMGMPPAPQPGQPSQQSAQLQQESAQDSRQAQQTGEA